MNKPAAKEPSMDEILSSIRQIIADDDAARRPAAGVPDASEAPGLRPTPALPMRGPSGAPRREELEPLALTAEQMVTDEDADDRDELNAQLVEPDDVAFDFDEGEPNSPVNIAPTPVMPPPRALAAEPPAMPRPAPQMPRPQPRIADAAPMPDRQLSADMAEELLEPATDAAVRNTLSRLSNLGIGAPGLTIEAMMRDMLRPMLKEWLDENLPAVVERMVEKEISRISRGID